MKSIKIITGFLLYIFTLSCVKNNFDEPTIAGCTNPKLTKTKEITDVYKLAKATTSVYPDDDILETYVISSDEGGNFYKNLVLQPTDGSNGLTISLDEDYLYTKNFRLGQKIFIKPKGLSFANPTDFTRGLIFGSAPTGSFPVDRLSSFEYSKYLFPSCDIVNEDNIVKKITITEGNSGKYLNNLVEFDAVQFVDEYADGTYDTDRNDDFDSSIFITDGTKKFIVRTSRFANIAANKVPNGQGKIRGVLSKYGTLNQITIRTERDVNMPNLRVDYILPLVGNKIEFLETFIETFETYAVTTKGTFFPKYINDAFVGSRYWDVKSYSKNNYIQMTSYASGGTNKTYLLLPIAFTPGNNFSFKTKDGSYTGNVLKVYYTTDYDPEDGIAKATLTDITSRFIISKGTISGFARSFTSSGDYTIPDSLTGNGYFVFEYSGNIQATTTMQIDDVIVKE